MWSEGEADCPSIVRSFVRLQLYVRILFQMKVWSNEKLSWYCKIMCGTRVVYADIVLIQSGQVRS